MRLSDRFGCSALGRHADALGRPRGATPCTLALTAARDGWRPSCFRCRHSKALAEMCLFSLAPLRGVVARARVRVSGRGRARAGGRGRTRLGQQARAPLEGRSKALSRDQGPLWPSACPLRGSGLWGSGLSGLGSGVLVRVFRGSGLRGLGPRESLGGGGGGLWGGRPRAPRGFLMLFLQHFES